jgi:hypothetical protein
MIEAMKFVRNTILNLPADINKQHHFNETCYAIKGL